MIAVSLYPVSFWFNFGTTLTCIVDLSEDRVTHPVDSGIATLHCDFFGQCLESILR